MFSDSDPVFPYPRSGDVFSELIPGAGEQVRVAGAAHFLQEDSGEDIGARVLELITASAR
jgi:haloalkane dehalogenase